MSINARGRGANTNSTGRFQALKIELDPTDPTEEVKIKTEFFNDSSRSIVTENDSPDIPFRYSMNFYRGCEHGCSYCYARPTHEYLGMSAGIDFESKIFVKQEAPQLLREKLMSRSWQPECIHISGVTDCYQPAERHFQLTRQCLKVLAEFKNPVSLITKNALITRDLDILKELADQQLVVAMLSVTSLDTDLARKLEPRTSTSQARLAAVSALAKAGVPVGVNIAPVIPGLNDHELIPILKAAQEAGAQFAGFIPLRLPLSVSQIFADWLQVHRPLAAQKILHQVQDMRGGKLNDPRFTSRMQGFGPKADNMREMFRVFADRLGLNDKRIFPLRTDLFQRPGDQLELGIN